jgi:formiminoglutamase
VSDSDPNKPWLEVVRGSAPLVLSIPHAGTELPEPIAAQFASPWLARKDTDWHVDTLYSFAAALGATMVRTRLSRTVIDVNRDPSGRSLYPGQATTELCPSTTFDGEPLYLANAEPGPAEIAARRERYFEPYHLAIGQELGRLQARYASVVLFDAHSIRSEVPRLFAGELPQLNLGTNSGASCAPALAERVAAACRESSYSFVRDGRFKGGYITRHYGAPPRGIHALQLELACRAYLREPRTALIPDNWPVPFDSDYARRLVSLLRELLTICIGFAAEGQQR